jgi:thymidine kinase
MAKLTFTYGTMNTGKSTMALQLHYQLQNSRGGGVLWTFGDREAGLVTSRIGISSPAHTIDPQEDLTPHITDALTAGVGVVVVDEVQFASINAIDCLAHLVDDHNVDVHAFGLGADFTLTPFPATARLFALADVVSELPLLAYCFCGAPARCNARIVDGVLALTGPQHYIGDVSPNPELTQESLLNEPEVTYQLLCRRHYFLGQLR